MTIDTVEQRREKLAALRERGNPFPNDFKPNSEAAKLHEKYDGLSKKELEKEEEAYQLAGRIMRKRIMEKDALVNLQDASGRIQLYIRENDIANYDEFISWDLGDIISVKGKLTKTRTGELGIAAQSINLLVKAARPLPEKRKELKDVEKRYRQRYLDLITSNRVRTVFRQRTKTIQFIRQFLIDKGFLEVETPMMQHLPGGALARPFETYYEELRSPMFLRVAPELFLKQLVIGGFERVFEINRSFRNEGISHFHNPEFTMLEFYQTYANHEDMMKLTEQLLNSLTQELHQGEEVIPYQKHKELSMHTPFARLTHKEALLLYNPAIKEEDLASRERLIWHLETLHRHIYGKFGKGTVSREQVASYLKEHGIEADPPWDEGKLQNHLFKQTVEHHLIQPTFITEYPAAVSPLARRNDQDNKVADRFQLFIAGNEIANGFSELNDYDEQARVFYQQLEREDDQFYDSDYITALEYGMPPTAGEGIGIDRLVMLMTNQPSIRDVLLFPISNSDFLLE